MGDALLVPLSGIFGVNLPAELEAAIRQITRALALDPAFSRTEWTANNFSTKHKIVIVENVPRIDLPLLRGAYLSLGAGGDTLVEIDISIKAQPFELKISDVKVTLNLGPDVVQTYFQDAADHDIWKPKRGVEGYNFTITTGFSVNDKGKVEFTLKQTPTDVLHEPFMIANSGFIIYGLSQLLILSGGIVPADVRACLKI